MATNDIGARVKLDGEREYREQMRQITQQTKLMAAETKSLESSFGKNTTAMQKVSQQSALLRSQIEQQKNTVATAAENVKVYTEKTGENSSATLKWKTVLAEAEAELARLEKELSNMPNALQLTGQRMQEVGSKMEAAGKKISSVGTTLTTAVTVPLTALATAAVKTTADFDSAMSKVAAVSGATGSDFDQLRSKAREMGSTTKFSATDAASAFNFLAMAGWKTGDMLNGIEGIMNLAAASGEDLATTSDIVTDALTAFGLSAEDSGHFADILAAASSNANTNVSMMGETFKYVAPLAGAMGYSAEDTAEAIGLMANAGIKSSQAGTSLRKIMTSLTGDVKICGQNIGEVTVQTTNADGSMRSLSDILADCRTAFSGLTDSEKEQAAQSLVGQTAMSGFLALMNAGEADIAKLSGAIDNCDGTAEQMAKTMQDNLSGQLTILKSQLQELAISFGDILVPKIRTAVEWVQTQVDKFNSLDDSTKEQITKMGLLAAAIGPVVTVVGKLTEGVGKLVTGVGKGIEAIGNFSASHSALMGVLGPVGVALGVAAAAAIALKQGYDYIKESAQKANPELYDSIDALKDVSSDMEKAGTGISTAMRDAEKSIGAVKETAEQANTAVDVIESLEGASKLTSTQMQEMGGAVSKLNALFPGLNLEIDSNTGKLNMSAQSIRDYIAEASKMMQVEAYHKAVSAVVEKQTEAYAKQMEASYELKVAQENLDKAVSQQEATVKSATNAMEGMSDVDRELYSLGTEVTGGFNNQGVAIKDAQKAVDDAQAAYDDLGKEIDESANYLEYLRETLGLSEDELADYTAETEDAANATGEYKDEVDDTITVLDKYGNKIDATTGEIVEYKDTATQAYMEARKAAESSIETQIGLFDQMSISAAHSVDEVEAAFSSQTSTYNQMAEDMETAWSYAVKNGDTATQELIRQIAALGIEGSGDMAALAQAIRDENTGIVQSMASGANGANTAKERYANILAQVNSNTVATTNGIVWTYDAAGNKIVAAVSGAGNNAKSTWNTALNAMTTGTATGMNNITSWVGNGMGTAQTGVQNASNGIRTMWWNTMDSVGSSATTGMNTAMWNAQNAIWNGYYGVYNAAASVASAAANGLGSYSSSSYSWGLGLANNFANGIWGAYNNVVNAAQSVANTVWSYLHHSTPEDGPLKNDDEWGGDFIDSFVGGMIKKIPDVKRTALEVANAATISPDRFQYSLPQSGAAQITQALQGAASGDDITINVYASDGMDVNELADKVQARLALVQRQRAAAYA